MCDTLNTAIAIYAAASCRSLTATMLSKLPGELRNLISSHLFDRPLLVAFCRATLHQYRDASRSRCCRPTPCPEAVPEFLQPEYMVPQVWTEMLGNALEMHRRVEPATWKETDVGTMYFGFAEETNAAIEPWFSTLHVELALLGTAFHCSLDARSPVPSRAAQVQQLTTIMLDGIPWRAGRCVNLYIQVQWGEFDGDQAALLVWLLRPGLQALRKRGFKAVKLQLRELSSLHGWPKWTVVDGVRYVLHTYLPDLHSLSPHRPLPFHVFHKWEVPATH
jgi:hypothetical protein